MTSYVLSATSSTVTNVPNSPNSTSAPVLIANLPSGGSIGTAAVTVDVNSTFIVTQTTVGQTITLPNPTNPTGSRLVTVASSSSSTTSFTIYGKTLTANQAVDILWNGSNWLHTGGGNPTTQNLEMYSVTRLLNVTGQQSTSSTTPIALNLSSSTVNLNTGGITPVLASGQFTFPATSGDYRITLNTYSDDSGATASALIVRMLINGVETIQSHVTGGDSFNFGNTIDTVRTIPANAVVTFTIASSDNETLRVQGYDLSIVQLPTAVAPLVNTLPIPFANGGIVFGDGTNQVQDLTNLFYDNTNNRLGIGTDTPSNPLYVRGKGAIDWQTSTIERVQDGVGDRTATLRILNGDTTQSAWHLGVGGTGNNIGASDGDFYIYDEVANAVRLFIDRPSGRTGIGTVTPDNTLEIGPASVPNTGGIRLPITSASANQTGGAIGVNADGDIVKIAAASSSSSYMFASISSQIVIGAVSAQDIIFNQVGASSSISLNGSGEFLLQGGVTYELDASCPWQVNSGTAVNGNVAYSWVDSSNNLLGTTGNVGISSFGSNGGSSPGNGVSQNAKLIYTAPFTQNVKVRITNGSNGGAANLSLYQRGTGYPTPYVIIRSI